jgi:hypothetical protein
MLMDLNNIPKYLSKRISGCMIRQQTPAESSPVHHLRICLSPFGVVWLLQFKLLNYLRCRGCFFFILIISQTVGLLRRMISPSQDRYLNTGQHKQNKHTYQTSMPRAGFEPTIPASERAKTVHALDRAATVTGWSLNNVIKYLKIQ